MKAISLILVVWLFLSSGIQAADYGRIAIYADIDRAVHEVYYPGSMHQFEIFIFCLPDDDGLLCAEFAVDYPENVIAATTTVNPELSIAMGSLGSGMSACFAECRNGWVWTHKQVVLLGNADLSSIGIVPHPETGEYSFANCLEGNPIVPVLYSDYVSLNSGFEPDVAPPVEAATVCSDQNHVNITFDEALFRDATVRDENFTLTAVDDPGESIPIIASTLLDGDRTIALVIPDLLDHERVYRLSYSDVMDLAGNSSSGAEEFIAVDVYPPEYIVSEIDPDRWWIKVEFNEPVNPAAARCFRILDDDLHSWPDFEVIEAEQLADGRTVRLTFDYKFTAGVPFKVQVWWVRDLAGNQVDYDDFAHFHVYDTYPPEIRELWVFSEMFLSVVFDEDVDLESALDPGNYLVYELGDPESPVDVYKVTKDYENNWFYVWLSRSVANGEGHVLLYDNICDVLGNCIGTSGDGPFLVEFGYGGEVATLVQSYDADYSEGCIAVNWDLSEAVAVEELRLSRSCGGGDSPIEPLAGAIHVDELSYKYIDHDVVAGEIYSYALVRDIAGGSEILFETGDVEVPVAELCLGANKPNPFNPVTEISFSIPEDGYVRLDVYDVSGRRVRSLVDGFKRAGTQTATWDGLDDRGAGVASGVYFYRVTSGKASISRKMVLLR